MKKELRVLIDNGDFNLLCSEIIIGENTNIYKLKKFSKEKKFTIGFFSEGWWQRDMSNAGFSIEDSVRLVEHLKLPLSARASTEIKLFDLVYKLAKKYKYTFSLYLHPCEERALKKGFIPPYLKKIDDETCLLGTKESGVSNFYEVKVGVTMLPSSSIITDRSSEGLKTFFLSNQMLVKHAINHGAGKLYKDVNEIEIVSFEGLDFQLSRLDK
jgi:hypothetical protein